MTGSKIKACKTKFLNWVDKYSKFLDKDKIMIHDILDSWIESDVAVPGSNSAEQTVDDTSKDSANPEGHSDEDDFDSIFGSDGEESDTDLFGATASRAGVAAKVSASDVLNRIKSFDFTL